MKRKNRMQSQDFELNLASIIDCFVVLIAFILVSTSFVSIGILEAGVAAPAAQQDQKEAPEKLALHIRGDKTIGIQLSGRRSRTETVSGDYEALSARLARLKQEWPGISVATLSADDNVDYREVIKAMEVTKRSIPAVALGGF